MKPKLQEATSQITEVIMVEVVRFNLTVQETMSGILGMMVEEPTTRAMIMTIGTMVGRVIKHTIGTTAGRVIDHTIGTTLGWVMKKNGTLGMFKKRSHSPQRKLEENSSSSSPLFGSSLATLGSRNRRH